MPGIQFLPLSFSDPELLLPLLEEEEKAWMAELRWDYSPIRQILINLLYQRLLPGTVALADNKAIAYCYFLVNRAKATIGSVYASTDGRSRQAAEEMIALTIANLKNSPAVDRIEAQIMPFNNIDFTHAFVRHNFSHRVRYFMELDLNHFRKRQFATSLTITEWNSEILPQAAELIWLSYCGQVDADLSQDYCTKEGCTLYLHNLIESPGCGWFMLEASFVALDEHGCLAGFVISSRISTTAGIIPQIVVSRNLQGRGVGSALINHALEGLKRSGMCTAGLTVTAVNHRAYAWYRRLGFRIRKEFGAYVWQR